MIVCRAFKLGQLVFCLLLLQHRLLQRLRADDFIHSGLGNLFDVIVDLLFQLFSLYQKIAHLRFCCFFLFVGQLQLVLDVLDLLLLQCDGGAQFDHLLLEFVILLFLLLQRVRHAIQFFFLLLDLSFQLLDRPLQLIDLNDLGIDVLLEV